MYLLDTNVISEVRKPKPHGGVIAWLKSVRAPIFLSAVTLGELQRGVELTRLQDPEKARQIEDWIDQTAEYYETLPMDGRAFREWARLMHGKPVAISEDAMLAATARIHRLTLVTRNTRDFQAFDVPVLNPFST